LHEYLYTFENLQARFVAYQLAYNKLLLEMGRRRQYAEAAARIVRGMVNQLDAMADGQ
jgi:autophagy-related protein 17